jgi:hypothetical protein
MQYLRGFGRNSAQRCYTVLSLCNKKRWTSCQCQAWPFGTLRRIQTEGKLGCVGTNYMVGPGRKQAIPSHMSHIGTRWSLIAVLLTLGALAGCSGVSTGKPAIQQSLPGVLSSAPGKISFGNVTVGTSQSQSGTLTNSGESSLTITQSSVTGAGFSVTGLTLPLTLSPGASTGYSIVLNPQSTGSLSGNLTLANTGSPDTLTVSLSGTGVTAGTLSDSPTSFSFGTVQVGSSVSQTETLKNTGDQSLIVSAATISGSGFSFTGLSLPLTLAANQNSTFAVRFSPTSAGSSNGNLSIMVSGSTTAVDIALSGTGVTPAILTAAPPSLTFSAVQVGKSQTQQETIQNTGGSTATISQASATGTGFTISGLTTPLTLLPGQSAAFSVTFAPQSAGSFTGGIAITSDASNSSLIVPLTGSATTQAQGQLGINPTTINVGSVVVGSSGAQTATLSATGGTVTISSLSLGGTNPSEFSIGGLSYPFTVIPSQSVNFTVTFAPQASGVATATATFISNASNSPVATLTGTGTAPAVHTVSLSWTASTSSDVSGYNVYRAVVATSCGSYSKINSTLNLDTTFTDTDVTNGVTYCYTATSVDSNDQESGFSTPVQAAVPAS